VDKADGAVFVGCGAKMVAKGHGFPTGRRCLKLFLRFGGDVGVKTKQRRLGFAGSEGFD